MACRRSNVRWACGAMPPATRLPAAPRPVSPAVNSTREGLTLTPGMKPRPFSTGRSARTSRRSMVCLLLEASPRTAGPQPRDVLRLANQALRRALDARRDAERDQCHAEHGHHEPG